MGNPPGTIEVRGPTGTRPARDSIVGAGGSDVNGEALGPLGARPPTWSLSVTMRSGPESEAVQLPGRPGDDPVPCREPVEQPHRVQVPGRDVELEVLGQVPPGHVRGPPARPGVPRDDPVDRG